MSGGFGRNNSFLHRINQFFCFCLFSVRYCSSKVWCHTPSSIDQRTDSNSQLNGRDLKGLSKGNRSQLYLSHIFFLVHDRPGFSRQIHTSFGKQPEFSEVSVISVHSQPKTYLDKHRITGILGSLYKILGTMTCSFGTVDPAILYQDISRAVKPVIHRYYPFFQPCSHCYDLEGRSRFIGIIQAGISPHLIQTFLLLLLCHFSCIPWGIQSKRIIQIKFRYINTGINFSILRIHDQNRNSFCLFFLHYLQRLLLSIFLNINIQT